MKHLYAQYVIGLIAFSFYVSAYHENDVNQKQLINQKKIDELVHEAVFTQNDLHVDVYEYEDKPTQQIAWNIQFAPQGHKIYEADLVFNVENKTCIVERLDICATKYEKELKTCFMKNIISMLKNNDAVKQSCNMKPTDQFTKIIIQEPGKDTFLYEKLGFRSVYRLTSLYAKSSLSSLEFDMQENQEKNDENVL